MAQKANPINLGFDISTLKYNLKKKKKLLEEKDSSVSLEKEEAKQKSKGQVEVVSHSLIDDKPSEDKGVKWSTKALQYQDDANVGTLQLIIRNLEKELFDKKTEIRVLSKNFKEKITLTEAENKKLIDAIEDRYNTLFRSINESSENRIREIALQYEANTGSLQKEHVHLLNTIRTIRATHISIDKHKEKMTELNETWEGRYNALRENFEGKYKQLFNRVNEAIKLKSSICRGDRSSSVLQSPEEILATISQIQIEHEIGYSSYVLDLLGNYHEGYDQLQSNKRESLDVLKTFVIKKFNELMLLCDNHNEEKQKGKPAKDIQDTTQYHNKANELVNYDSTKIHLSIGQNNDDKESQLKYNDISQERSKIDNFTSEFESFNFNEDSLPNRNIQVLTPPDMIN